MSDPSDSRGDERLEALEARIRSEDTCGYMEAVRALPRPTAQQIADFVGFVSCAHSWYKHLPFTGHRFEFFLNPVPDGYDANWHYAAHSVAYHVKHFGYVEYREIGALPPSEPTVARTATRGFAVPLSLLEVGSAIGNPMLHPRFFPNQSGPEFVAYEETLLKRARPKRFARWWNALRRVKPLSRYDIWEVHSREQRAKQLVAMQEAIRRMLAVVFGPSDEPLAEPRQAWFQNRGRRSVGPKPERLPPPKRREDTAPR